MRFTDAEATAMHDRAIALGFAEGIEAAARVCERHADDDEAERNRDSRGVAGAALLANVAALRAAAHAIRKLKPATPSTRVPK